MAEFRSTVVGVFEVRQQADRAVEELRQAGFRNEQIGVAQAIPAQKGGTAQRGEAGQGQDGGFFASVADFLKGLFGSNEEAGHYEGEYRADRTVVTVNAESRSDEAWSLLHRHGAYNRANPPAAATATEAARTMQLREEELRARKHEVETGEVRARKEIVTETKTLEVPVQREAVVIERRPASPGTGAAGGGTTAGRGCRPTSPGG